MNNQLKQIILVTCLIKKLVQFNTKCLTTDTMTEKRTNNSFFNPSLVEMGTNDLLKKQLVMNLPLSLNFARSNDVSISLITSVNFLKNICLKSCIIFQASPLFTLWWLYKKLVYLLEHLFIFFILDFVIPFATTK
jgi:hypothetical protein